MQNQFNKISVLNVKQIQKISTKEFKDFQVLLYKFKDIQGLEFLVFNFTDIQGLSSFVRTQYTRTCGRQLFLCSSHNPMIRTFHCLLIVLKVALFSITLQLLSRDFISIFHAKFRYLAQKKQISCPLRGNI